MSVWFDWLDEQRLVIAYLSAKLRMRDLVNPIDSEDSDPRFRQYNELIVIQDVQKFTGRERGTNIAMEMSENYGPDPGYKSAYVVKGAIDLGLVRIFNAYRGRHPDSVEVFLGIEPALSFLGHEDEEIRTNCYQLLEQHAHESGEELWF